MFPSFVTRGLRVVEVDGVLPGDLLQGPGLAALGYRAAHRELRKEFARGANRRTDPIPDGCRPGVVPGLGVLHVLFGEVRRYPAVDFRSSLAVADAIGIRNHSV